MYEYKNNEKLGNAGFARIEARNHQCKLFIHMNVSDMEGKLLKAYMFSRKLPQNHFAYLGNVLIQNQTGELKIKCDRNNVMNSDLDLDDMCGIIIYQEKQSFFACEWDGKPIHHHLIDAIETLDFIGSRVATADTKEGRLVIEDITTSPNEICTDVETVIEDTIIEEVENSSDEIIEEVVEAAQIQEIEETSLNNQQLEWISTMAKNIQNLFTTTELKQVNEEESNNSSRVEMESLGDGTDMQTVVEYRNLTSDLASEVAASQVECQEVECIQPMYDLTNASYISSGIRMAQRYECHPHARDILKVCPRVYPFEDNEIMDCVRIHPQDIGRLPMSVWHFGNNSFLLHGYYTYHHLLFGTMTSLEGLQYIIGVPGVYHERETAMARMFGFDTFKSVKRPHTTEGEFGYYYAVIQFD